MIALVILVIYLLTYSVKVGEDNRNLQKQNKSSLALLSRTNEGIVNKLTEVFAAAQKAEDAAKEAGTIPAQTVAAVVESLKGYVDPKLIQEAIDAAKAGAPGPQGKTGPAGPQGPAGTSAQGVTTTSTATTTTTTSIPSTTTTTQRRGPPTTPTTRCAVKVLGICI